jgi:succinate dehydrogenase / fumarate reductase cytochrome b subunit
MTTPARPLSPHLQVYRPQLTSVLSLIHRATGILLSMGLLVIVWMIAALHRGYLAYWFFQDVMGSIVGQLFLVAWTWALFFHLLNGLRHLGWDAGWGLDLKTAYRTGWTVVIGSVVLTLVACVAGYAHWLQMGPQG